MEMFNISASILDADGNTQSVAIKTPAGNLTLAEIREAAQGWAEATDLIIEGQITELRVELEVALPVTLKVVPEAQSNVQEGALFSFVAQDTKYKDGIRLPAFQQDYFVGKEVDEAQLEVAAWLTGMILGWATAGTTVTPSDKYGNDYLSTARSYKSFRK